MRRLTIYLTQSGLAAKKLKALYNVLIRPSPAMQRWFNRAGSVLGLGGCIFVVERLWNYKQDLSFSYGEWHELTLIIVLSIVYAVSSVSLALGWYALLRHLQEYPNLRWSVQIYAITQLSKYIPGNIFQFAGRQVMGAAAGIGQKKLLQSTILELILLIVAGLCFVPLVLPIFLSVVSNKLAIIMLAALAVVYTTCMALVANTHLRIAAAAYGAYIVMSGTIFLGVFALVGGRVSSLTEAITVIGAFAISWLVGLLTPGAPAGLGVREAILILLLKDIAPEGVAVTAIVTSRFVTTFGDILFFGAGRLIASSPVPR